MEIINSATLRGELKKYLDLAGTQDIIITRKGAAPLLITTLEKKEVVIKDKSDNKLYNRMMEAYSNIANGDFTRVKNDQELDNFLDNL